MVGLLSSFSMTGVTKAVVCAVLSVGWWTLKNHSCKLERTALVMVADGFLFRYLTGPLPQVRRNISVNKMC